MRDLREALHFIIVPFSLRSIRLCKVTQCVFSVFNETHRKSQLLGWCGVMRTFGHVKLPQKHKDFSFDFVEKAAPSPFPRN